MSWERGLLILVVLACAVAYYGLVLVAIRDLIRRPAVRGGSKFGWVMLIICIPIVGALVYGYMGPASFLPRVQRPAIDLDNDADVS